MFTGRETRALHSGWGRAKQSNLQSPWTCRERTAFYPAATNEILLPSRERERQEGLLQWKERELVWQKKCRSRQLDRVMLSENRFCQSCHFCWAVAWCDCCVCENKQMPVEMNWNLYHYFESPWPLAWKWLNACQSTLLLACTSVLNKCSVIMVFQLCLCCTCQANGACFVSFLLSMWLGQSVTFRSFGSVRFL